VQDPSIAATPAPDRGDRAAKLIEAGLVLSSELSLDHVLQRLVDVATEVVDARYGALGVLDHDGRIKEFLTTGVTSDEREAIGDPPVGHGLLGLLIREGRPIRVPDIASDPRSVGFPPNHPQMTSFMGTPVKAHGRIFGNIYLTEKIGAAAFTDEDERTLAILAAQAGVAIENARLYAEARRRERWLESVREIGSRILSGASSDEALELIAARAMELVGADLATIAIPGPGDDKLTISVAVGTHASALRGRAFPLDSSLSGEVIRFGRAAIVEDAGADEHVHQPLVHLGSVGPAMFIPLSSGTGAFGTLAVANLRGGRTFGDEDVRLVETFAAQAAVALEYERARQQAQRLALMEDRERIAKELHDGVIQSLFAVGMGLQGASAMSAEAETARRLDDAVQEIDRVIRDLRNYIFGLRPGILADRQLDQALRELTKEFEQKSEVVTVVDIDEDVAGELGSRASELIQMTREALSNVGRHAAAATCRVSLHRDGHNAILAIDDDGEGFDPAVGRPGGQGLTNLRARAEALGGETSIESSAAEGTTVRITIPL